MTINKKIIIAFIGLLAVAGVFHFLNQLLGLKDDNPLEQVAEEVVELETGVKIDLTPNEK